eukprot:jgi/Mesvir1/5885/Mv00657-RA.1
MVQALPAKENNIFKSIVKFYETKQYKKGLKAADLILKKFPEHGETLAMKGLTLNCLEKKEEAYELVRKGLKNDLGSHVCWHVYGLLYRSDRDYPEAIKCYRNALRIDKENIQILRDMSLLQLQMRDLAGLVETRRQLLTLKPNNRNNWIGFSVAQHLNGSYEVAALILDAYEGTIEELAEGEKYENSEMLMYKAMLLEEADKLDDALAHLDKCQLDIVDKLSLLELKASLFRRSNKVPKAEELYRRLLRINPDHTGYHEGLQWCLGCCPVTPGDAHTPPQWTPEQVQKLKELYQELGQGAGWSSASKRIPLDFLQGDEFGTALDVYVRPFLRKGVPSLFSDLRSLYRDPAKVELIEKLFLSYVPSLDKDNRFPGGDAAGGAAEPPSTIVWVRYFLAHHFNKRDDTARALEHIDAALAHTPTAIDLYMCKSKILKHAGNRVGAARLADSARKLDLADRFLNSKCAKRMLEADQVSPAEKTISLFTRDGDQLNNLFDMQCMWYELAIGASYCRRSDWGRALKKYLAVEKHYQDMMEDQFDFHTYCLRKMTLRAYVRMLRMEDKLHEQACFRRGAAGAIRVYLHLFDHPPQTKEEAEAEATASMSAAEKKKYKAKLRKEEARKQKEAEEAAREEAAAKAAAAAGKSDGKKKGPAKPAAVDPDPDGDTAMRTSDPLGEATKLLALLQAHAGGALETHQLAFQVAHRRGKRLLALQAVKRMLALDAAHPDTHRALVTFWAKEESLGASPAQATLVDKVMALERAELPGGKTVREYHQKYLEESKGSIARTAAALETLLLLHPSEADRAAKLARERLVPLVAAASSGPNKATLAECVEVHQSLEKALGAAVAAEWKAACAARFPWSSYFEGKLYLAGEEAAAKEEAESNVAGVTAAMGKWEIAPGSES